MRKILNILLIEDDPDDIELFREAIEETSVEHSIHVLMQGDEVIPHLLRSVTVPDAVVLDLNLPKMPGKEILSQLKSIKLISNIPVAILTTSNAKSDIDFCLMKGAEKFIIKPTTIQGFREMAKSVLEIATAKVNRY